MADHYFGLDKGEDGSLVSAGAATTGKDIEVVVDLAVGVTTKDVVNALTKISEYLLEYDQTVAKV